MDRRVSERLGRLVGASLLQIFLSLEPRHLRLVVALQDGEHVFVVVRLALRGRRFRLQLLPGTAQLVLALVGTPPRLAQLPLQIFEHANPHF